MRFSVRGTDVCPGKEKRTLRKDAFCIPCRTEKCILIAGRLMERNARRTRLYSVQRGIRARASIS